jgi:hypothetical protein
MKENNDQKRSGAITIDFKRCPLSGGTCGAECRWFRLEEDRNPREKPWIACGLLFALYSS